MKTITPPEFKAKFESISNINSIITYINNLVSNNIKIETKITLNLERFSQILDNEAFRSKFEKEVPNMELYRIINKAFPMRFSLINVTSSEVIIKLADCIAIVSELIDQAVNEKKITPNYYYIGIALIGSLDELMGLIHPIESRVLSASRDSTHLMKTVKAIYLCASKLTSLEKSVYAKTEETDFLDKFRGLSDRSRDFILEKIFLEKFDPTWIDLLDKNTNQRIFNLLIDHPETKVSIDSDQLFNSFKKLLRDERRTFLKTLSSVLDMDDLQLLKKGDTDKPK